MFILYFKRIPTVLVLEEKLEVLYEMVIGFLKFNSPVYGIASLYKSL